MFLQLLKVPKMISDEKSPCTPAEATRSKVLQNKKGEKTLHASKEKMSHYPVRNRRKGRRKNN